jgi:hypothetical protein
MATTAGSLVRVYVWDGTTWFQRGDDISGEALGDFSGWSVSLSANGMVVTIGADFNDGNGKIDAGHVRVYSWDSTTWIQQGNDFDEDVADDRYCSSTSLSSNGSVMAVGAYKNGGNWKTEAGLDRAYVWDGASWFQRGNDIHGEAECDWAGRSVSSSADDNVLAIGSPYSGDANGEFNIGHAHVYEWNGAAWDQLSNNIYGETE